MGIHLSAKVLIKPGDVVVVGETNYGAADISFERAGATIIRIPVDGFGLDTGYLEQLLNDVVIRAVYVTPHHHHPTTTSTPPPALSTRNTTVSPPPRSVLSGRRAISCSPDGL